MMIERAKRELLAKKNKEVINKAFPDIYKLIQKTRSPVRVLFEKEGLDAELGGVRIYGGDAYKASMQQVERFKAIKPRINNYVEIEMPPDRKEVIAFKYGRLLCEKTGRRFEPVDFTETGHIPLLFSVGLGFGVHIQKLIEEFLVQNLIVVELPHFIHLSLYYLDWAKLIEYFSKPGRNLFIYIPPEDYHQKDPDEVFEPLIGFFKDTNPALLYYGYYFVHLNYNPPLDPVSWIREHPKFRELHYGYLDDRLWSLEWTIEKIYKEIPLYFGGFPVPENTPAFVVGAGPSLDKTINSIKENKDKAIIISCGSAITALENAGLKPDIHVELERTKYTYDILSEVNKDFLKGILFIAVNPVWTECFELFDEAYMVSKSRDIAEYLFAPLGAPIIRNEGPTVTALGVSVAAELGFKNIYLFGVDLGSKYPENHHTRLSNYYNSKSMLSKVEPPSFNMKVRGNYGGEVYTNFYFAETAYHIGLTAKIKKLRLFNLSDGMYIQNSIPLEPEELDFELAENIDKVLVLDIIRQNFRRGYSHKINIRDVLSQIMQDIEGFITKLRAINPREIKEPENLVRLSLEIPELMRSLNSITMNLLYPNTYQWSVSLLGYGLRQNSRELSEFIGFFLKVYVEFLTEAKESVRNIYDRFFSSTVH